MPGSKASVSARFGTRTMGRSGDATSRASASPGAAKVGADGTVATITAKGFSSRCLRARSAATASAFVASQARWKPPKPLMATIFPARSSARVSATGSSASGPPAASSKRSRGPQCGQQVVSAWKRRSAGSAYSRAHSGQSGKGARLVCGRS